MSAIPFSSAAANATEHACSRHADILGPRFCAECRAPLCTACVRYRAHRACPSCNVAAGRKQSQADVGWYAVLFVDGIVHALSTVKHRVLPFAIAAALLGLVGFVAVTTTFVDAQARDFDNEAVALAAFTSLLGVLAAGLWAQPALSLPTVARVGFFRRVLRSVVGTTLPFAVIGVALAAGGGLVVVGEEVGSVVLTVVGTLVGVSVLFLGFALSSLVLPIQAAYALRGRSLLGAIKAPFEGGGAAIAMMTVTWLMLLSMLYSGAYALVLPVVLLALFAPWLGAVFGVIGATAALVLLVVVTAGYASAGLRIAEDRARR